MLKPAATIYARIFRLSFFYTRLMCDPALGLFVKSNAVACARSKSPKPYQTESSKALNDEQVRAR